MSKLEVFRDLINQQLTAAALEIFSAVERSFVEFEEEISRSQEERARLQRLLDILIKPDIKIHRAGSENCVPVPGGLIWPGWTARARSMSGSAPEMIRTSVYRWTCCPKITGVITQGAKDFGQVQFVSSYKLAYSNIGITWTIYQDAAQHTDKVFQGNLDNNTHRKNAIEPPIYGRFLSLIPWSWYGRITLRAELLAVRDDY